MAYTYKGDDPLIRVICHHELQLPHVRSGRRRRVDFSHPRLQAREQRAHFVSPLRGFPKLEEARVKLQRYHAPPLLPSLI